MVAELKNKCREIKASWDNQSFAKDVYNGIYLDMNSNKQHKIDIRDEDVDININELALVSILVEQNIFKKIA